jgi:hypothetical protein
MLKTKLMSMTNVRFQDCIDTIYGIIYEDKYTPVKQKRDKGTDGLLSSTTSLAIYAPEKYSLADFKKKTSSDYKKYKNNWQINYPSWNVITNKENTGEMLLHVKGLYEKADLISVTSICDSIRNQSWSKIARIFKALELPDYYLSYDVFSMIIDDITSDDGSDLDYSRPIYIKDKIDLNITDEEIREAFLIEYEEYFEKFQVLQKILSRFDTGKVLALRSKINMTYQSLRGNFIQKLSSLVSILSQGRENDDYYQSHVRIIIFYFFEQCLIGKKTESELNHATPRN